MYRTLLRAAPHLLNLIFIIDIVLQFFHGYMDVGFPVMDPRRIARRYVRSWFLIDLVSILPFDVVGLVTSSDVISSLKLVRVVRLLKIARQYDASIIIVRTIKVSLAALLVPFFTMMVAIIIFASVLFYLELEAGGGTDGGDSAFHSIPHAIWFMLVTTTTVGFGDVSPNTGIGKALTACAMVRGRDAAPPLRSLTDAHAR